MAGEGENDIDELAASVSERLRETPWVEYDSPDPKTREAVHNHVFEIREDLDKIADVDPQRALKVWDENIPDEYEARAAMPDPEAETAPEENTIELGGRRRRRDDPILESEPVGSPSTALVLVSPPIECDTAPDDQTPPEAAAAQETDPTRYAANRTPAYASGRS